MSDRCKILDLQRLGKEQNGYAKTLSRLMCTPSFETKFYEIGTDMFLIYLFGFFSFFAQDVLNRCITVSIVCPAKFVQRYVHP